MPEPTPTSIGLYQILDTLGQGGMGVVYRARDPRSGRQVAIKTVHVPHEGYLSSLRREIDALAALRHPGVVSILDQGVVDGAPWYAMELVAGPTLRAFRNRLAGQRRERGPAELPSWWTETLETFIPLVEREPTGPFESLPEGAAATAPLGPRAQRRLLRVMLRLCETLATIHAAGLIHGDLKPENVLIGRRDRPVLVDFGLTARFLEPDGREPLEERFPIGGSFAYMAPEQIRGEIVDARADLYAFGCLLFEMLSGRRVFEGDHPHELILAQMAMDPPSLAELVEGLAPELDALVSHLLAKEPRSRLGQAGAVAVALRPLVGAEAHELPTPQLYRPAMVGRKEALGTLLGCLGQVRAGRGGLVVVCGESGLGKTRLAAEFLTRAQVQGMLVSSGACMPIRAASPSPPLHPLRSVLTAVADRCRSGGAEARTRLLAGRGPLLSLYFPALAETSGVDVTAELGELAPEAARLRLYRYLWETLVELALGEGGLVVLLDDTQLADELTAGFLHYIAHSGLLESQPVLFVATCRTDRRAPSATHGLGERATVVALERLEPDDVAEMVADMLGLGEAPAEVAERLEGVGRGNPFFVAEYLRAALAAGLLERDLEGRFHPVGAQWLEATELPLPTSVRDLLRARVERLHDEARRLLAAAAVLGREESLVSLARVAALPLERAGEALERLLAEELVVERGEWVEIERGSVREFVYDHLEGEAAAYHRRAALLLEERANLEALDAELGEHWRAAGEPALARPYLLAAAREAVLRFARADAERFYRDYLSVAARRPTEERTRAELELARDVLAVSGRLEEAITGAGVALANAVAIGDPNLQVAAFCELSRNCQVYGRVGEAVSHAERALEVAERLDEPILRVKVLNRLATLAMRRGANAEAAHLGETSLALARTTLDRVLEADTRALLGVLARARGDLVAAEVHGRAAADLHRASSDPMRLAVSLAHLGSALAERGQRSEAKACQTEAKVLFERVGDRRWEAIVLGNLAALEYAEGQLDDTARDLEAARMLLAEVGDRRSCAFQTSNLAGVHARLGHAREAEALFVEALEEFRALEDPGHVPLALCGLTQVRRRQGVPARELEELLDEADFIVFEQGSPVDGVVALCERGHVALLKGEHGMPWLERARALAVDLRATETPHVVDALARLDRAVAERRAGRHLVYGDAPDS